MNFLSQPFAGLPLWGWLAIGGVAAAAAFYLVPKFFGGRGGNNGGLGTAQGATNSQPADPNIDPNTGVPYSVEEAINPKTGLPAYFDLFNQSNSGGSGSGGGGTSSGGGGGTSGGTVTTINTGKQVGGGGGGGGGTYIKPSGIASASNIGPFTGVTSPSLVSNPGQNVSDWEKINQFNPARRGRTNT